MVLVHILLPIVLPLGEGEQDRSGRLQPSGRLMSDRKREAGLYELGVCSSTVNLV